MKGHNLSATFLFLSGLVFAQGVVSTTNPAVAADNSITQSPPDKEARRHYLIALEALKNDDLIVALDELKQASTLAPNNALIWYNIAVVESKKGQSKSALDHLHNAEKLGIPDSQVEEANKLDAHLTYQLKKQGNRDTNTVGTNSVWLDCIGKHHLQVITKGPPDDVINDDKRDAEYVFVWSVAKNHLQGYNRSTMTLSDASVASVTPQEIIMGDTSSAPENLLNSPGKQSQWLARYHGFASINRATLTFLYTEDEVWNWKSRRDEEEQEVHSRDELPCKIIKPLPVKAPQL